MKLSVLRTSLYICLLISGVVSDAYAQSQKSQHEGAKPYTPTRVEWFAVELNSEMRVDLTMDSGYMLDFIPIENEDTIIIRVIYIPSVNREVMNMSVDTARRVISEESNSRGWSSWLKVKEQIEMKELKSN